MLRTRLRSRGGGNPPWYTQGKANSIDPSFWADFVNQRHAYKSLPLRAATARNQIPFVKVNNAGSNGCLIEYTEVIGHDLSSLVLSFNNKILDASTGDTNVGNGWTIQDIAIINGSRTISVPVTFSGVRTKAIADGDINIQSDPIYPSSFGLTKFSRNDKFYIKGRITGAASFYVAAGDNTWANYGNTGDNVITWWYDSAVTTPSSTDLTTRYTATGTALTWGYNGPKPIVLGTVINDDASIFAVGDSISSSVYDGGTNQITGAGLFQRSMRDTSNTDIRPSINTSVSSLTLQKWLLSTFAQTFMQYCQSAYVYIGTNDVQSSPSLATMQSRYDSLFTLLRGAGMQNIILHKLLAYTTSTDSWATEANQTPYSAVWNTGGLVSQINSWFDTKLADSTVNYLLTGESVLSSDRTKWKALMSDAAGGGLHPNALGHETLAIDLRPVIRNVGQARSLVPTNITDLISFTRSTTATYFDSTGTMQTAAIDALRFDYNPVTLQPLGVLVEDQRTNFIPNNSCIGAVDGVIGSGGSLPTGWGNSIRGLNLNVTNITNNGIPSLRLRIYGTPSSSGGCFIAMTNNNSIVANNTNVFSNSIFCSLQSGTFTNVSSFTNSCNIFSGALAYLQTIAITDLKALINSTFTRYPDTGTVTSASAAYIQSLLQWNVTSGLAVDFTIDIGAPQLELGNFSTSTIFTTTAAVTRAADLPLSNAGNTIPFANWSNGGVGTIVAEFDMPYSPTGATRIAEMWASSNESMSITRSSGAVGMVRRTGGVSEFAPSYSQSFTANQVIKSAGVFVNNDYTVIAQGGTPITDATSPQPLTPIRIHFGYANGPVSAINGHLRSIRFYPARITNSELQRITT